MSTDVVPSRLQGALRGRSDEILKQHQVSIWKQTDRLFAGLLCFQYFAGIAIALWISSKAWEGLSNRTHPHVWSAVLLGLLIISLPVYFAWRLPGRELTRQTIAMGQMAYSALLIHLCGGRIETHFHVFGSLAFLAFYRDRKVLLTATIVVAVDHMLRGIYWPQSVFGLAASSPGRALEHAGWVVFEDLFLLWSCNQSMVEMRDIADQRARLESTNELIEAEVRQRTDDLAISQQELIRSVNLNKAIVETAADGIVTINSQGIIQSANAAVERIFGYSVAEMLGQDVKVLMPSPFTEEQDGYLQAYMRTGIARIFGIGREVSGRRRDGTIFPVDLSVSEIETDGERTFTGIIRDISVRRRSENLLAEQSKLGLFAAEIGRALVRERGLQDTLRKCAEAMISHLDAAFARIWTLNDAEQILELQASAGLSTHTDEPHGNVAVGKSKIGMIAAEKLPQLTNEVFSDPRIGDKDWARREGMVAFAGHPLIVQDRVVGVMAVFARHPLSDFALNALASVADSIAVGVERARSDEQLKLAMDAAEQANVAKSQFLANMSHELRTPMNAIIGYSEMLAEECVDVGHSQYLSDLERIRTAGKHLLGLINDILDLSKIEAGRMEVFAEDFDVAMFLKDVMVTVKPLMEQKQNRLIVEPGRNLGVVHSDQTKIRQILFNLLSNASKFTDKGLITVNAKRLLQDGREWLSLQISDSGIGMTEDQLTRIFDAFTQAEASTTRRFGGTGLGLTITRRFCEILGGTLTVTSTLNVGSTFTVRIPVSHGDPSATIPRSDSEIHELLARGTVAPYGTEILVIDDEPDARELMRRYLQKEGYTVITANSGLEGLELARERSPAAITLDVMMPGMDGWAVLQQLKEDPSTADIPVIMISMVDNSEMGYALGVADYLTKPPDRQRLNEILQRVHVDRSTGQILIVDDDENNRTMLVSLAEKTGCQVRQATNGREALDAIAKRIPDVILLDLMMPVMDGFEVIAELNRQGLTSRISIVVLTAKDLTREDNRRLEGQVDQIRNKLGISRDELLREIYACLDSSLHKKKGEWTS